MAEAGNEWRCFGKRGYRLNAMFDSMGGGGILSLQRILGHSSITMTMTMTMRYAHLSPDHLESALRLSPLAQCAHADVRDQTVMDECINA